MLTVNRFFLYTPLLLLLYTGCSKKPYFLPVKGDPQEFESDIIIKEFSAYGVEGEKVRWEMEAKKASIDYANNIIELISPVINYYEPGKPGKTHVVADKGKISEGNNKIELEGAITVDANNGKVLKSDSLVWNKTANTLISTTPVYIRFPGGNTIRGSSMTADTMLNKVTIKNPAGVHRNGE